jgi:hypothetical protein
MTWIDSLSDSELEARLVQRGMPHPEAVWAVARRDDWKVAEAIAARLGEEEAA